MLFGSVCSSQRSVPPGQGPSSCSSLGLKESFPAGRVGRPLLPSDKPERRLIVHRRLWNSGSATIVLVLLARLVFLYLRPHSGSADQLRGFRSQLRKD